MTQKVIACQSIDHFKQLSQDHSWLFLNFWAPWAEPCSHMNQVFEELAAQQTTTMRSPALCFIQIEAEELADISEEFEISAVPTCLIVHNGEIVERLNGANAPEWSKAIEKYAKQASLSMEGKLPTTSTTSGPPPVQEDIQTRLKKLTTMAPVVLFMKGSPAEPKCGFSRQICSLLDSIQPPLSYRTFDILTDDQVRQELKVYANWPTYPQLWIQGELVGGLDIVKEMVASGDLQSMIPREASMEERLNALIRRHTVMIFIKGTPTEPRCGFSRQLISLLDDQSINYDYFDILTDEEVRQQLKVHSNWPTYPQVYVRGELVGGLDIVKEMMESGDFQSMLQ